MQNDNYSSELLEKTVDEFASLPGIGRRSALRLALHMMKLPVENVARFTGTITKMRQDLKYCRICHMISDEDTCSYCRDKSRDAGLICVVESIKDVISIENTGNYKGLYHVLGSIISPMDGVGPSDLPIDELVARASSDQVREVILALNTTPEGEMTAFYIFRKLSSAHVAVSCIARGVGFGDEIEYADEMTLGRSIENRQIFKPNSF